MNKKKDGIVSTWTTVSVSDEPRFKKKGKKYRKIAIEIINKGGDCSRICCYDCPIFDTWFEKCMGLMFTNVSRYDLAVNYLEYVDRVSIHNSTPCLSRTL